MPGMDLRPELPPPSVSQERQEQLGREIDRIAELIETGRLMEAREAVAAFNMQTGHTYEPSDFAAYWESQRLEDLARDAARGCVGFFGRRLSLTSGGGWGPIP